MADAQDRERIRNLEEQLKELKAERREGICYRLHNSTSPWVLHGKVVVISAVVVFVIALMNTFPMFGAVIGTALVFSVGYAALHGLIYFMFFARYGLELGRWFMSEEAARQHYAGR